MEKVLKAGKIEVSFFMIFKIDKNIGKQTLSLLYIVYDASYFLFIKPLGARELESSPLVDINLLFKTMLY